MRTVPPVHVYTISPDRALAKGVRRGPLTIKLAPVRGMQALYGTKVLYTDTEYSQESYAYSRWSDAPARLLQMLFQTVLQKEGPFKAVLPPTSSAEADLLLESTLYDFSHHLNGDGTSDGVIRVRFYLIDNREKTVIATREFSSRVPALSCNARGAVVALNRAATEIASELVSWLVEEDRGGPPGDRDKAMLEKGRPYRLRGLP